MQSITTQPHSIRDYVIGEIVGYVEKQQERERELAASQKWHCLHVLTGYESDIATEIERNGMAAYVPTRKCKLRVNCNRHREATRPLFPGYMFVAFDPQGENWKHLAGIEGVIRLFMVDGHPVQIPDAVINRIHEVEQAEAGIDRDRPPMPVMIGAAVRIVEFAAWSGLFGLVNEVDNELRRVRINVTIMRRVVPLWLDEGKFEVL